MDSKHNYVWFAASLFCSKSNWHSLIKAGVRPFLDNIYKLGNITAYQIKINYERGENIRIALLMSRENVKDTAAFTDNYFNQYFKDSDFSYDPKPYYGQMIFMPFPSNTIQYGLYTPPEIFNHNLEKELSNAIMDGLSNFYIDDDSIMSFALYLSFAASKSLIEHFKKVKEWILKVNIDKIDEVKSNFNKDILVGQIAENKNIAKGIALDVCEMKIGDEFTWLDRWAKACERFYHLSDAYDQDLKKAYSDVINFVCNALSLTQEQYLILVYFMLDAMPVILNNTPN